MRRVAGIIFLSAICGSGCTSTERMGPTLDPYALQSMQTREFNTDRETLFASSITFLQNAGFTIRDADVASGVITADGATTTERNWWTEDTVARKITATAFVEQSRPSHATARLTFVESTDTREEDDGGVISSQGIIEDASVYERAFNDLRNVLFVREKQRKP